MPEMSANLSLPLLLPAQAQKHVTHNEALQVLDALVQLVVLDRTRTTPPATPAEGDRHIVPGGPTGWSGPAGSIATRVQGAWVHHLPRPGWQAHVLAETRDVIWQGGVWGDPALRAATLGVNTGADTTNRLAVSAPATLFTHEGAGHQIKINKAAPGQTASLLFQTGFSGRAEIGLAGTDDLSVKVSATGAVWTEALVAEAATGRVRLPAGVEVTGITTLGAATTGNVAVTGLISGTALTQTPTDATAGRLLKVGDSATLLSGGFSLRVTADGTANAIMLTTGAGISGTPPTGMAVRFRATATNTAAVTIALDGGAALAAVTRGGSGVALPAGYVRTDADTIAIFSGTNWTVWRAVERGSNANGDHVRFEDGTQLCISLLIATDVTTAVGSGFRSAAQTWTCPAAFSTMTGLGVFASSYNNVGTHWSVARPVSTTSGEIILHAWTSTTGRSARALAMGRWF